MRCIPFLFLLLFSVSLSAQDTADPIDAIYAPIYNQYKNKLQGLGYNVGRAGNSAWVRGQYTLEYNGPNAATEFSTHLQQLKNIYGARKVRAVNSCGCGDRKLFAIEFHPSIFGEERGMRGREEVASNIGKEEVDPNYYLLPELEQVQPHPAYNQLPANFSIRPSGKPAAPVKIAVLDTGIDPYFQDPANTGGMEPLYLWENPNARDNCYPNDIFGWDFVNNDNAPVDDNSHGTHVASRIAQQLGANAPDVNYQFMSLKMLDNNGVGNSFHAACAVLYAAENGADVINASWGFYGELDKTLKRAFRYAQQRRVATMTSAGNLRVDLTQYNHYPSEFALENYPVKSIFFVSATRSGTQLWPLTNYRVFPAAPDSEFMAAPGGNLWGLMPHHFGLPGNRARKSGTSISTPFASALAAHYKHLNPGASPLTLRDDLKDAIEDQGSTGTISVNGQTVEYKVFNWVNF
ncbi:MAG: S8 family serine peptidase [Bacteroidota bacterium]